MQTCAALLLAARGKQACRLAGVSARLLSYVAARTREWWVTALVLPVL